MHAKHVFKQIIYSLCLYIGLRMVGGAKVQLCTQICKKTLQKIGSKLSIPVEIIALGNPCNLKISFMKIFAMVLDLYVDLTGIKCDAFVNLSTKTMMESCCLVVIGNLVIESMEINSHFHSRIGKGCNKLVGCWCSTFTCWLFIHLEMYSAMSFFIPD